MEDTEKVQGTEEEIAGCETPETEEVEATVEDAASEDVVDDAPGEEVLTKAEAKLKQEAEELRDKYTRLYAEFDNFRKRSEKEKSQMFEFGARDVIEKLLPVVDNFERALATVPEDTEDAFQKGVSGIYKQIQKVFEDLKVEVIPAEGEKFDPNLHNAVMQDTDSDAEEGIITQDLQRGYTYRGTVVRHSMVKVKS